jgi:hypothetical protein
MRAQTGTECSAELPYQHAVSSRAMKRDIYQLLVSARLSRKASRWIIFYLLTSTTITWRKELRRLMGILSQADEIAIIVNEILYLPSISRGAVYSHIVAQKLLNMVLANVEYRMYSKPYQFLARLRNKMGTVRPVDVTCI